MAKKSAKSGKLIVKANFDDGSRRDASGRSIPFNKGDVYDGADSEKLIEQGLVGSADDVETLKADGEDKDAVIKALEEKVQLQDKEIGALKKQLKMATVQNSGDADPGHAPKKVSK